MSPLELHVERLLERLRKISLNLSVLESLRNAPVFTCSVPPAAGRAITGWLMSTFSGTRWTQTVGLCRCECRLRLLCFG